MPSDSDLADNDLADSDLFKCEKCRSIFDNDESCKLADGRLVCEDCSEGEELEEWDDPAADALANHEAMHPL